MWGALQHPSSGRRSAATSQCWAPDALDLSSRWVLSTTAIGDSSTIAGQTLVARKIVSSMRNEHFLLRIVIPSQLIFLCVNKCLLEVQWLKCVMVIIVPREFHKSVLLVERCREFILKVVDTLLLTDTKHLYLRGDYGKDHKERSLRYRTTLVWKFSLEMKR